ncbi:MAG: hypothetical protein HOP29_12170 [Phycisphaerales bacterium]|nr:hypothetical protein [Phycisphaerales bacterium]
MATAFRQAPARNSAPAVDQTRLSDHLPTHYPAPTADPAPLPEPAATSYEIPARWAGDDPYRLEHRGSGDWEAWGRDLELLTDAVADWRAQLAGVDRPWLCWCVLDRFCRIQQRLVMEFGWTPVVGGDPRAGAPTILPGAVPMDCNRVLQLPAMWMWMPVEFAHELAPRLAFWHSDLLVGRRDMERLVRTFDVLDDGEVAAYRPQLPRFGRTAPCPGTAACTTRAAARDQWDHGCGWWRWFTKHPNFAGEFAVAAEHWDHGYGLRYWKRHYGGMVRPVSPSERGHCKLPWGRWKGTMSKGRSIESFFDIGQLVRELGIADLDD